MTVKKRKKSNKLLSSTRPPIPKPRSHSSRATRTLIHAHHTLQKQLNKALIIKDFELSASLQSQIDAAGGLQSYQQASIMGQSAERGGDSSKVLVEWLSLLRVEAGICLSTGVKTDVETGSCNKWKMLEVGALQVDNACSRSGMFDVERIDLHSQHPNILQQDFMHRPLPFALKLEEDGFDVVSLSLVVNYVGDAVGRGDMLGRVRGFLRNPKDHSRKDRDHLPALFLVLPVSCVLNSRYLNEERLEEIMEVLGFRLAKRKMSRKLVYYLWALDHTSGSVRRKIKKEEILKGRRRNNFAVVLR
ncbi:hypothetical protein MMC06_001768 [Schaereria dolodes]|nr:hypothetical protein [Schaereria dolodes]